MENAQTFNCIVEFGFALLGDLTLHGKQVLISLSAVGGKNDKTSIFPQSMFKALLKNK